jgi:fatty acid amide hydrolase 2
LSLFDVYFQPISKTAGMIRSGELRAFDLTRFIIDRARQVNPKLNAIIKDRYEMALTEAIAIDRRVARGEAKGLDLAGIPFSLKSNIALEGMPMDMGSWGHHGRTAPMTATVVKRLIDAGAIPIGVTNIAEMAMWHETVNDVYGRTINPWSRWRTAGGSSGGEGAIVAAGGAMFGVGTDLSGSVRTPAAFCGLYGHKPTRGLIPVSGQWPYFTADTMLELRNLDSIGPLTRHADDLKLILSVIRGKCELDPKSHGEYLVPDLDINWANVRVAVMMHPRISKLSATKPVIQLAMQKAARRLQEAGATISEAPAELFEDSYTIWRHTLHRATDGKMREMFGGGSKRSAVWEVLKFLAGHSEHRLSSSFFMFTEEFLINKKSLENLDEIIVKATHKVNTFFESHDLILMPTFPTQAPIHGQTLLTPHDAVIASPANVFGLPASAAPMGLSSNGMPISIQFVGKPGDDLLTISAAGLVGEFIPHPDLRRAKRS